MQQAVDAAGKSLPEAGGGEKALFTPDVWRHLKEPLKHTLVRGGGAQVLCGRMFIRDVCVACALRSSVGLGWFRVSAKWRLFFLRNGG